jgi:hypothetical protein
VTPEMLKAKRTKPIHPQVSFVDGQFIFQEKTTVMQMMNTNNQ